MLFFLRCVFTWQKGCRRGHTCNTHTHIRTQSGDTDAETGVFVWSLPGKSQKLEDTEEQSEAFVLPLHTNKNYWIIHNTTSRNVTFSVWFSPRKQRRASEPNKSGKENIRNYKIHKKRALKLQQKRILNETKPVLTSMMVVAIARSLAHMFFSWRSGPIRNMVLVPPHTKNTTSTRSRPDPIIKGLLFATAGRHLKPKTHKETSKGPEAWWVMEFFSFQNHQRTDVFGSGLRWETGLNPVGSGLLVQSV